MPAGAVATINSGAGSIATLFSVVPQQPNGVTLGDGMAGSLNVQSGGSLTVNGELWVGNNNSGNGLLNMTGGSLTVNSWLVVG